MSVAEKTEKKSGGLGETINVIASVSGASAPTWSWIDARSVWPPGQK